MKNMENLILHKNDETVKPWERGTMHIDTAVNSMTANVFRSNNSFSKGLLSKKLNNMGENTSNLNLFLNPAVESFLSFNITNATLNKQNETANFPLQQSPQVGNLFDQTLFSPEDPGNYQPPADYEA